MKARRFRLDGNPVTGRAPRGRRRRPRDLPPGRPDPPRIIHTLFRRVRCAGAGVAYPGRRRTPPRRRRRFSYGPGVSHRITTDACDTLERYFVDFADPRRAAGSNGVRSGAGNGYAGILRLRSSGRLRQSHTRRVARERRVGHTLRGAGRVPVDQGLQPDRPAGDVSLDGVRQVPALPPVHRRPFPTA